MEETSEEPPTSAVFLDNCHFSQVVFNNVEKFYVPGSDITCYYTLTQNIIPRGKDWVGIFRVGWKTTREYYTFMWAPLPQQPHGDTPGQQQIHFKAYYLPKDDEYYQFCYVDQEGAVRGASVPFQFRAEMEDDILVVTTQGEVEEIELQNKTLQKEKEELKATCASLQKQNVGLQEELNKMQELQKSLESLKSNTEKLELELNSLKEENKHLKELNECREEEVHQLKEQIHNVTFDKEQLERRLRTALEHMDQLQAQVLSYEKEVENLSLMDHDNKKQLESLKEENHQLRATGKQQVKVFSEHIFGEGVDKVQTLIFLSEMVPPIWKIHFALLNLLQKLKEDEVLKQLLQAEKVSSFSGASQTQAAVPSPEEAVLLFGNPYHGEITGMKLTFFLLFFGLQVSLRRCPMCDEVFPEDFETSQCEAHVQSHLLECPICSETFDKSKRQVFEDHMFCHNLE
ncbi:CACO2 protein, partial [Turnix velox]|nr:CACO2 protein [Turnix velox]